LGYFTSYSAYSDFLTFKKNNMSKSFNSEKQRKRLNILNRALSQVEQTETINQIITNNMDTFILEKGFPKIKITDNKWLKLSGFMRTVTLSALRLIVAHLKKKTEKDPNVTKWTIRLTENWLLVVSICLQQSETTPFFSLSLFQRELSQSNKQTNASQNY